MAILADIVAFETSDHGRPEILVAGDAAKLILKVGGDPGPRGRHVADVFVRPTNPSRALS